ISFTHRLLTFALLLVITGSGCVLGLDSTPDPIVVTATPAGTLVEAPLLDAPRVITATPNATPTLQPVSTPTLPPSDSISRAEQALKNGNYTVAVNQYQSVLNQDADSRLQASAWYGIGQAALREGLFGQAATAFTRF